MLATGRTAWRWKRIKRTLEKIALQLGAVSLLWRTPKQSVVALSSCEAEFIAATEACKKVVWVRHILKELGVNISGATKLMQDNQGAAVWENEGVRKTKHVAVRGNFVKQVIDEGIVSTEFRPTSAMTADILTKPINRVSFERNRTALGMGPLPDAKKGN